MGELEVVQHEAAFRCQVRWPWLAQVGRFKYSQAEYGKNSHKLKDRLFFNVTLLTALVLVLEKMAPSTAGIEGEAEGSRVVER